MKIYAKQVPPEYQESPLYLWEEWPENVFVFGNRDFNSHAERLDKIRRGLEYIAETFDDMQYGASWCRNDQLDAHIWIYLARDNNKRYTRPERLELLKLAQNYCDCRSSEENNILCRVLELVTGRKWTAGTIRGYCQGDWQEIIYPAEYSKEWLNAFEAEYFNTGTEWMVDPDGENYSVYVTGWSDDDARQTIANAAECDPCDVVLLKFSGWSRTANWEEN